MNRPGRLAAAGQWMQRHGSVIRGIQWVVVAVYAFLILVPAVMPLPDDTAHLWSNLTLAAQFVFWGIWWPFVLLSMVMLGRSGAACCVQKARSPNSRASLAAAGRFRAGCAGAAGLSSRSA